MGVLPATLLAVSLGGLCVSLWLLLKGQWFIAWLKGSFSFALLTVSIIGLLLAWQASQFATYSQQSAIGFLAIKQLADTEYSVAIQLEDKAPQEYLIRGEYWQLDARLLQWQDWISWFSVPTSYQLDRLSGRYERLEDEKSKERTVYDLKPVNQPFDFWEVLSRSPWLPGIKAKLGNGTFLPLSDGAAYSLWVLHGSIFAKAENSIAKATLEAW